jgi:hypothetical protein
MTPLPAKVFCFVFWWYWGLNSGLVLASQLLKHLRHSTSPQQRPWMCIFLAETPKELTQDSWALAREFGETLFLNHHPKSESEKLWLVVTRSVKYGAVTQWWNSCITYTRPSVPSISNTEIIDWLNKKKKEKLQTDATLSEEIPPVHDSSRVPTLGIFLTP